MEAILALRASDGAPAILCSAPVEGLTSTPVDVRRPGPALPRGAAEPVWVARGAFAAVQLLSGKCKLAGCSCKPTGHGAAAAAVPGSPRGGRSGLCSECEPACDAWLAAARGSPAVAAGLALLRAGWHVIPGAQYGADWAIYTGPVEENHAVAVVLAVAARPCSARGGGSDAAAAAPADGGEAECSCAAGACQLTMRKLRGFQRSAQTAGRRAVLAVLGRGEAAVPQFFVVSEPEAGSFAFA